MNTNTERLAQALHYPDTPSKAEFEALYLSLCERSLTIHEIARRCWKAGAALSQHAAEQAGVAPTSGKNECVLQDIAHDYNDSGYCRQCGGASDDVIAAKQAEQPRLCPNCAPDGRCMKRQALCEANGVPKQAEQQADPWQLLSNIDTWACMLPTFEVIHEGGPEAAAENTILAIKKATANLELQAEQQPASVCERWNIERDGEALLVCFSDHEKGEGCSYQRFVPEQQAEQQAGPVAEIRENRYGGRETYWFDAQQAATMPFGTKLYTHPAPSQERDKEDAELLAWHAGSRGAQAASLR